MLFNLVTIFTSNKNTLKFRYISDTNNLHTLTNLVVADFAKLLDLMSACVYYNNMLLVDENCLIY